jgi:two-component system cell cycle sensor histidine kinase/response regulator CckA
VKNESHPSEEALRESEERFRGAFEHSPIGMGIVALDGRFLRVNRALCRIGGYSETELLSRSFQDVVPEEELEFHRGEVRRLLAGEIEMYEREVRYRHKLGHFVWVRFAVSGIRGRDREIVHLLGQAEDISDRREAEERLRQAERLEAVGRLAGGIAHEFNNLLAVIGGFARHALRIADSDELRSDLGEIVSATHRAVEISRRLLTFSRNEEFRRSVLDVNDVVRGVAPMLRRLIPENVELIIAPAEKAGFVHADRAQLEEVVVNLVLNARDAIEDSGRIEITTRTADVAEATTAEGQLAPGAYAVLCVSDSGSGIEPEARQHLFDPFFTTKGQGEGTGLGLSIVYGIVERFDGAIFVHSEPGHGATFTVYIPSLAAGAPAAEEVTVANGSSAAERGGEETILVVEDEHALRSLIALILSEAGYRVLTATDGEEALKLVDRHESRIDLVITDSIMPRLGGSELARRLRNLRPGIRMIQMTGYSDRGLAAESGTDLWHGFIAKPFEPELLLHQVREVLDQP